MINEDKDIIDLLSEIETNLDEYEIEELTDIEKMKLKNNFRKTTKSNNYKKYVSVASIAIVSLGIMSQTKIGAYANSAIEDITDIVKVALGVDEKIDKYSYGIDKSITKHKLTIKIEDVILDGKELIIHMSRDYKGKLEKDEYIDITSEYLYVNGEMLNPSVEGYNLSRNDKKEDFVLKYELPKVYKGDIDIKLRIMSAKIMKDNNKPNNNIIGPWTFKFSVNGDKLNKDTKNIKLNGEMKIYTGETIKLESYRGNIISQKIKLEVKDNKDDKDIVLKGRDNIGNKVEFNIISRTGNLKEDYIYEYDDTLKPFNENAKILYLTPYTWYIDKSKGEDKTVYKKIGEEFKLELNK